MVYNEIMKNTFKLVGIINLMMVVLFTLVSCDVDQEEEYAQKHSGTIKAGTGGHVSFIFYNREYGSTSRYCTVTTNLPEPDNQFTLYNPANKDEGKDYAYYIQVEPFQKIKWKLTSDAYVKVEKNERKEVASTTVNITAASRVKY